jgi:hypothetical protein
MLRDYMIRLRSGMKREREIRTRPFTTLLNKKSLQMDCHSRAGGNLGLTALDACLHRHDTFVDKVQKTYLTQHLHFCIIVFILSDF